MYCESFIFNITYICNIMSYIWCSINKIETIKYHTVGKILKSYRKIIERGKIDSAKYMTSDPPDLIQVLQ
jgi:hypothetical protein